VELAQLGFVMTNLGVVKLDSIKDNMAYLDWPPTASGQPRPTQLPQDKVFPISHNIIISFINRISDNLVYFDSVPGAIHGWCRFVSGRIATNCILQDRTDNQLNCWIDWYQRGITEFNPSLGDIPGKWPAIIIGVFFDCFSETETYRFQNPDLALANFYHWDREYGLRPGYKVGYKVYGRFVIDLLKEKVLAFGIYGDRCRILPGVPTDS